MSLIKRSVSIFRSPIAAGSSPAETLKSVTPRRLTLAASAIAAVMSGTAFAGEPSAVDYFVAKVMVVQTGSEPSSEQANSTGGQTAYASAQDQFVDQVLKGRFPEGAPASQVTNTPANNPAVWPDFGFLRSVSPR
jgi:hypothetical protein